MDPVTITNATKLKLGIHKEEKGGSITTVAFQFPSTQESLLKLLHILHAPNTTITLSSPQLRLLNPEEERSPTDENP